MPLLKPTRREVLKSLISKFENVYHEQMQALNGSINKAHARRKDILGLLIGPLQMLIHKRANEGHVACNDFKTIERIVYSYPSWLLAARNQNEYVELHNGCIGYNRYGCRFEFSREEVLSELAPLGKCDEVKLLLDEYQQLGNKVNADSVKRDKLSQQTGYFENLIDQLPDEVGPHLDFIRDAMAKTINKQC